MTETTQARPNIALQLYTLREAMEEDCAGTLQRIADIGIRNVETAFFPDGITTADAARMVRDAGLTACSAHTEIPLGADKEDVLEIAEAFGCTRIIWHGWPQDADYSSVDGIKRLAERYNEANAVAVANGLHFGLHNHWWECEPVEGRIPYQILLEEIDSTIFFEVDTYWAKVAGLDPAAVVAELGPRAPLLHIKDGPATRDDPMVAAGDGTLDIPGILAASNGNAEWLIIEMDECASNMLTAVERSYRYLVGIVN